MAVVEVALTVIGAGFGSVLRYAIGGWVNHRTGAAFPWGTLAVNALGCFALGFLEGVAPHDKVLVLVLGKGVIAGFTTFSTLMLETLNLASAKQHGRALSNVVGSVLVGLAVVSAGLYLGTEVRA